MQELKEDYPLLKDLVVIEPEEMDAYRANENISIAEGLNGLIKLFLEFSGTSLFVLFVTLLGGGATLGYPFLLDQLVDRLQKNSTEINADESSFEINLYSILFSAIFILSYLLYHVKNYSGIFLSSKMSEKFSSEVAAKLSSLSFEDKQQVVSGSELISANYDTIKEIVHGGVVMSLPAMIESVIASILIYRKCDWEYEFLTDVFIPPLLCAVTVGISLFGLRRFSEELVNARNRASREVAEALNNYQTNKYFKYNPKEIINHSLHKATQATLSASGRNEFLLALQSLLMGSLLAVTTYLTSQFIYRKERDYKIDDLTFVLNYLFIIASNIYSIGHNSKDVIKAFADFREMLKVLKYSDENLNDNGEDFKTATIEFNNIGFSRNKHYEVRLIASKENPIEVKNKLDRIYKDKTPLIVQYNKSFFKEAEIWIYDNLAERDRKFSQSKKPRLYNRTLSFPATEISKVIFESPIKVTHEIYEDIKITNGHGGRFGVKDVSFNIRPGTITALVGQSGCGKSTITKLLFGFYKPQKGEIIVNGKKIIFDDKLDGIGLGKLREQIAFVPQKIDLYKAKNLEENLKIAAQRDVSRRELKYALRRVGLKELHLESSVENLSGGQQQLVGIAMALLKENVCIYIFDEATSALDNNTQAHIMKIIDQLKQENKTILMIAHRLKVIRNADNIIFLEVDNDLGKIKYQGTHAELMLNCDGYKDLYEAEEGDVYTNSSDDESRKNPQGSSDSDIQDFSESDLKASYSQPVFASFKRKAIAGLTQITGYPKETNRSNLI